MVRVDELKFGSIVIGGVRHRSDVLILADGTVRRRRGGFLMFGSHSIREAEIAELLQENPDTIVIGTGTDGVARVPADIDSWAGRNNVNVVVQPSYDAVDAYNELVGQHRITAALIHVTC